MKQIIDILWQNPELVSAILGAIATIYQTWTKYKACKTSDEKADLLINALKVDDKMINDKEFDSKLLVKVDEIAKATGASAKAVEEVKDSLKPTVKGIIKLASYKGKKVFLSDIVNVGKMLRRLFK